MRVLGARLLCTCFSVCCSAYEVSDLDLQLPHLRQLDMRLSHLPFKSACPLHVLLIIHAALFALQPVPVVFASVLSPVSYLDMQFLRLDAASCYVPCLALV